MLEIPVLQTASYTEEITLDGTPYRFRFNWNYRGVYWTFDILDSDLNVLVAGVKIVLGEELIFDYVGRSLPPGMLLAVDPTENNEKIGRDDLGDRVSLLYLTEEELDAAV